MAFPAYQAQQGQRPIISARLPMEHAVFLRAHASRTRTPLQAVIRALVAEWVEVHKPVHAQPSPAVPVAPAIPARAAPRQDTGKSEPAAVLVAIDEARKEPGKSFTD